MCFSGTLSGNRRSTALRGRHVVGRWSALDAYGTTHLSGVRRQSVLGLMESTASPLKHEETNLDTLSVASNRPVYSRAVAKRDHLVSASAGSVRGTFETSSLQVTGNALTITADIAEGGYVRVRLLDNSGKHHSRASTVRLRNCSFRQITDDGPMEEPIRYFGSDRNNNSPAA